MLECRICKNKKLELLYDGPVRDGGVNGNFIDGYKIYRCSKCDLNQLYPVPKNLDSFYESHEYRSKWDNDFSPSDLHKKYDHEQNERIKRIGIENLRNKLILDLGASSGVFLDSTIGIAKETIAIEPMTLYKDYHISKGHKYFAYPEDAIKEDIKVDVITCFDVIEHIEYPKSIIQNAIDLLNSGGKFYLSMPNFDDLLLRINKEKFSPFFFQTAHLNYFTEKCINNLFKQTDFDDVEVDYLHKYHIDNLLGWVKYSLPGKSNEFENIFDRYSNSLYKSSVEKQGIASHLFITATRR